MGAIFVGSYQTICVTKYHKKVMMEILHLISQMAPYLLLGFGLAGVLHAFVPQGLYGRYLGGRSFRSVLYATLLGIPLPLCSCGVIPTAMSLRKQGASKGATVSFLIATPQTGVDSIIATYSLMGLPFALVRPLAALVTALFGGAMVNRFGSKEDEKAKVASAEEQSHKAPKGFWAKCVEALRYAYVDMMQDIGKTLFVGLVIAGLITLLLPDGFFDVFSDNPLLGMLAVLVVAIPMYICATGSIPIAVALILKGLSPGAALVMLMAGPAASAASVMVVGKVLGRRTLVVYLASIIVGAIAFGLGIDYVLPREWFTAKIVATSSCHEGMPWLGVVCTVVLLLLLVNALLMRHSHKGHDHHCECGGHCEAKTNAPSERVVTIEGLRCNHCKANAERALMAIEGVKSVVIEMPSGRTTIVGVASDAQLREALEPLGFTLKVE